MRETMSPVSLGEKMFLEKKTVGEDDCGLSKTEQTPTGSRVCSCICRGGFFSSAVLSIAEFNSRLINVSG